MEKVKENLMLVHALRHPHDSLWMKEAKRLCASPLNWTEVFKCADSANIGPLLYRQLRAEKEALSIPEDGFDVLKNAYFINLAKNSYQGIELGRILQAFKNDSIDALLLKGASISEAAYHDPGARIFGDLDILVRKEDMDRAQELLGELGYQAEGTAESQEHYRGKHHHLAPMIHPEKSVVVELHWNINPRIHVDVDGWFHRSVIIQLFGIPVRILGLTDMVLHTCLHLFSSGETRTSLRGVVDIYRVVIAAGDRIDWELLDEEAKRYGIQEMVNAVLQATQNIMDPQAYHSIWPENMPANPSLVAKMEAIAFSMRQQVPFPGTLMAFQAEKRWLKKTAMIWHRFFPSTAEMKARYGLAHASWKIYFYYLLRPFQLFGRYGRFGRSLLGMKW